MPTSRFDPVTAQAREVVDQSMAQIYRGLVWSVTHTEDVGDTSVATILIRTPATTAYLLNFSVLNNQAATWTFEEGTTATVGSALVSYCYNRSVANDSLLSITHTPTLGTAGTVLTQGLLSAGRKEESTWRLLPSTDYVLRYTATTASTVVLHLKHEVVR